MTTHSPSILKKVNIITAFAETVDNLINFSIIKRAQEKTLVEINIIDLREFGEGKHQLIDDRPYGGGAGMLLRADVLAKAVRSMKSSMQSKESTKQTHFPTQPSLKNENLNESDTSNSDTYHSSVILTSARGKKFDQHMAKSLTMLDELTIICGHYEGVDQRFIDKFIDEEVSIGDFVMTGGEIAAAAMVDAVVRLLPGVLQNDEATKEETFMEWDVAELSKLLPGNEILKKLSADGVDKVKLLEYPHYTRPEIWEAMKVPEVLLSGNHNQIQKWRLEKSLELTFPKTD